MKTNNNTNEKKVEELSYISSHFYKCKQYRRKIYNSNQQPCNYTKCPLNKYNIENSILRCNEGLIEFTWIEYIRYRNMISKEYNKMTVGTVILHLYYRGYDWLKNRISRLRYLMKRDIEDFK